jgi:RNA polymerase sigma-70 factor (ECF subfamily)
MKLAAIVLDAGTTGMPGRTSVEPANLASDEDLVRRIEDGDVEAFRVLVERYADRWHGVAFRLLNRRDGAEDVVQDVFMQLWSKPGQFRPIGARFSTWGYRVLVNRCVDRLRKAKDAPLPETADPADPAIDALSQLMRSQRESRLLEEIARLPDRQRVALSLVYTAGLTNKQAAEALDLSLKALEALLVRAKRALRAALSSASGEL